MQAILGSGIRDPRQRLNYLFTNVYASPWLSGPSTDHGCALSLPAFSEKKYALRLIRFFTSFHDRFARDSGVVEALFGVLLTVRC